MNAKILLEKLKKKFQLNSDKELAEKSGINPNTISQWKTKPEGLNETMIANLIYKAVDRGGDIALQNGILPIVEFYPVEHAESRQGAKWEILPTNKNENPYQHQIRRTLMDAKGIYLFYNSAGKVLYAGKTLKQDLWKEMNDAFNRNRAAQTAYFVNHPQKGNFLPAHEKQKRLTLNKVYLHDIAYFFSAYKVHPALISNLEAFLIRALPNDLSNTRMESFNLTENGN